LCTELFSFGETPWANYSNEEVIKRMKKPRKLDRPTMCPDFIYALQIECWKLDPVMRPTVDHCMTVMEAHWEQNECSDDMHSFVWPCQDGPITGVSTMLTLSHDYQVDIDSSVHQNEFRALEATMNQFQFGEQLGSGAFGTVYRGTFNGQKVAIKMLLGESDDEKKSKFLLEAHLLVALRHPNIVSVRAVSFHSAPTMIALELMADELKGYLNKLRRKGPESLLSVSARLEVCSQVAKALEFLARSNVIHRDVAARFDLSYFICRFSCLQKCTCWRRGLSLC
jgi:hypothetical protein